MKFSKFLNLLITLIWGGLIMFLSSGVCILGPWLLVVKVSAWWLFLAIPLMWLAWWVDFCIIERLRDYFR